MSPSSSRRSNWLSLFLRDYGIVLGLLLLAALFSLLTLKQQHPTGADAGRQVASEILSRQPERPQVLIVARDTEEDRQFASAAAEVITDAGATVLERVHGSAVDARRALEQLANANQRIDWIVANDVTAKWTIYDRFPEVGASKCVTPRSYTWPDFLKATNLIGVANQTAIHAIIAIGMTMVIITGGIDLSVGSLVALSAVVSALIVRDWGGGYESGSVIVWLAMVAGTAVCGLAGVYHGALITAFRVPAFVVTLGMMLMARGASRWLSDGRSIPELPASFFQLGAGETFGVPNPILLMVVLYLVAHIIMGRTVFGRYVYAIGGNAEAARLSGVPVKRVLVVVYAISGALAGLGGVVLASRLGAGDPKFGNMYELEVIAAVVVGGTSLMGGQGKVLGTLIGALIINVITNGMNLTGVDPDNQLIVLGAVLTAAVLFDAVKRRKG